MKNKIVMLAATLTLIVANGERPVKANLITNGAFQTGDFTGWTLFTTSTNGSLGFSPLPQVSPFDVTGHGVTNAAEFQVGQVDLDPSTPEGGGIAQVVSTGAGTFTFSANIAAFSQTPYGDGNAEAGAFSVLLDGATEATQALGNIDNGVTLRTGLSFSASLNAGQHDLEILITRKSQNHNGPLQTFADTPFQFVTDITLNEGGSVPEPSSFALLGSSLVMMLGFLCIGRGRIR